MYMFIEKKPTNCLLNKLYKNRVYRVFLRKLTLLLVRVSADVYTVYYQSVGRFTLSLGKKSMKSSLARIASEESLTWALSIRPLMLLFWLGLMVKIFFTVKRINLSAICAMLNVCIPNVWVYNEAVSIHHVLLFLHLAWSFTSQKNWHLYYSKVLAYTCIWK